MARIFIVEDERIIAENLRQLIVEMGFEVAAVKHAYDEALQELENLIFDIALLDINLGSRELGGMEIARHINEHSRKPFIFLTAYTDREFITSMTALQPSGYLVKPVEPPNLFAALQLAMQQLKPVEPSPDEQFFYAPVSDGKLKVFWSEVGYIKAGKNYCQLWNSRQRRKILIRSSLRKIMEEWIPRAWQDQFILINRSTLVAGVAIERTKDDQLQLNTGEILKMSQSGRVKVKAWLERSENK